MDPNRPPQDQDGSNQPPPDRNIPQRPPSDHEVPNRETADRSPPEQTTPGRTAPDRPPPEQGTPGRTAPGSSPPERATPGRTAPGSSPPERATPGRTAPDSSPPERATPGRSAPERYPEERSAPVHSSRDRSDHTVYRPTYGVPKAPPPQPPQGPSHDPGSAFDKPGGEPWTKCIYNKDTGEYFYRTPKSWILILSYSAMYLIFLMTFTLVVLYISLLIIKETVEFNPLEDLSGTPPFYDLLTYPEQGIGLSATPTSEDNVPLIWYKNGESNGYDKYVKAIDQFLLSNRRKREVSNLGPCGQSPYGYGEKPCIIVRINKQFHWAGKPLNYNSTMAKSAPAEVQAWMRADKSKLWLQCNGFHSYDKEHIGRIKYYPDPPGFDASIFPLDAHKQSPLVAVQISEFTMGISLAIECKLWYDTGPSTFEFMLYVAPGEKIADKSGNV